MRGTEKEMRMVRILTQSVTIQTIFPGPFFRRRSWPFAATFQRRPAGAVIAPPHSV
jgi:hypothetical protein